MNKYGEFLKKTKTGLLWIFQIITLRLSPKILYNEYYPILYDILHPAEITQMRKNLLPYFENKKGICIGGALRWEFQKYLKSARQVINVDAVPFFYNQPTNADYLTDATDLYFAKDHEFDFVCSSHVLEHLTNPIKALKEWIRVTKKGGIIYCGVPDKRFTFDHKRQRTALPHLIDDYQSGIGTHDTTHLRDIINNSDVKMDFINREQCFKGISDYVLSKSVPLSAPHHHVYTYEDIIELFKYVELKIIFVTLIGNTIHLVAKN